MTQQTSTVDTLLRLYQKTKNYEFLKTANLVYQGVKRAKERERKIDERIKKVREIAKEEYSIDTTKPVSKEAFTLYCEKRMEQFPKQSTYYENLIQKYGV